MGEEQCVFFSKGGRGLIGAGVAPKESRMEFELS